MFQRYAYAGFLSWTLKDSFQWQLSKSTYLPFQLVFGLRSHWIHCKIRRPNTDMWMVKLVSESFVDSICKLKNVMLTFSVLCNWWICFYLQYRFTITTSTNIFITPQDNHCLTANYHKNIINIRLWLKISFLG